MFDNSCSDTVELYGDLLMLYILVCDGLLVVLLCLAITVFTRVRVDLSRPKNQSKKSTSTYTWVKN